MSWLCVSSQCWERGNFDRGGDFDLSRPCLRSVPAAVSGVDNMRCDRNKSSSASCDAGVGDKLQCATGCDTNRHHTLHELEDTLHLEDGEVGLNAVIVPLYKRLNASFNDRRAE